jgi:hypothetical protein
MLLVKELATACPNADFCGCRVFEVSVMRPSLVISVDLCIAHQTYLCVELGINASEGARHDEAADHFTAAINAGAPSSKFLHQTYEDLTVVRHDDIACIMLFINN